MVPTKREPILGDTLPRVSDSTVLDRGADADPAAATTGRSWSRSRQALAVFCLYTAISVLLFGVQVLGDPTHRFVGSRLWPDPDFFIWAMAWWPHAVTHGLNPMLTHAVWAPHGYNLAWATGAPGPSLLVSPITALWGPVASYNLLAILACPLAAWSAFLLCRRVTGRLWASVLGGYVFGFSTYLIGHIGMHVNLELVFAAPLCAYLVLRRLDGTMGTRRFVVLLTLVLVFQFLTSTEVFATLTLVGVVALAVALAFGPRSARGILLSTVGWSALSFLLTAVLVSPYLYYLLTSGVPHRFLTGSDLLSPFLPRGRTQIGSWLLHPVTQDYPGSPTEDTIYLGPALLGVLVHFGVTQWRARAPRLMCLGLVALWLALLGPTLSVNGHASIGLPWRAVRALPLLSNVAPRRLSMYVFLLAGVVLSLWLSSAGRNRLRWAVALLVPVFLLPSYSPVYLYSTERIPGFFSSGLYRQYLRPEENVLLIPAQNRGDFIYPDSMAIQAATGFSFRLLVGYTGPFPPEYRRSEILQAIYQGDVRGVDPGTLRRFLQDNQVGHVLVGRGSTLEEEWTTVLGPPLQAMDVLLYPVPP
jgi:hypothetical protein